jgi:hypothetical protein
MQVGTNEKVITLYPEDSMNFVSSPSEMATAVIQQLAEYILTRSSNDNDWNFAREIVKAPLTYERCNAAEALIASYGPFIAVVPDSENYWKKADGCFLAIQKNREAYQNELGDKFVAHPKWSGSICKTESDGKVSFHMLTISQSGFNALVNYQKPCCMLL